jgi:endonuclease YncB( thermonuclease family)
VRGSEQLLRAAAVAAALVLGGPASAAPAANAVSVVDGENNQIGGELFPLYGIDAPVLGQLCVEIQKWSRCGIAAAVELRKLLKFDVPVRCEPAPGDPSR